MNEKTLNVRLSEGEFRTLARYAGATGRTKTDVVREFIRSLARKAKHAIGESQPDTRSAG